jgi:hypothetical protein
MPRNVATTSRLLSRLLMEHPPYRTQWVSRVERLPEPDKLSYQAVCRVIAEWTWVTGEIPETVAPRSLRDRVRRALVGEALTPETLRWFVQAFAMEQRHANELSNAYFGTLVKAPARNDQWAAIPSGRHDTLSLNEFHYIGPERRPVRHRTVQVIRATVGQYDRYPYLFDTASASVMVYDGGSASDLVPAGAGLWRVDIQLTRPLAVGETAPVVYDTRFDYPEVPVPEFRRAARRRVLNVNLRVQFHSAAIPAAVAWNSWTLDDRLISSTPVQLDSQNGADRFLESLEAGIVGFAWRW